MDVLDLDPAATFSYPSGPPRAGSLTISLNAKPGTPLAADYRIPNSLRLGQGELGFMYQKSGTPPTGRVFLSDDGILDRTLNITVPTRHAEFLKEFLISETRLMMPTDEAPDDSNYAYHGQFPESTLYWPCFGPICRLARNERVKSTPSYRARHTNTPRPQRQYRDTELLIFFAQTLAYKSWVDSTDPLTQTKLMKDMNGRSVRVWDLTPKEELMRTLFDPHRMEQYLLDNTRNG